MSAGARTADWISLEAALDTILAQVNVAAAEEIELQDAFERVLAQEERSPVDLPPWHNSGMDGFAVRSVDIAGATRENPVRLAVIDSVPAGGFASHAVGAGQAIKIMTGAPVPDGADSVVRVEHTRERDGDLFVLADTDAQRNIRPRGEDIRSNDVAAGAGALLRPGEIGLLASIGCARVRVRRRPVVAILSTGDELVDVEQFDQVRAGRRIVNSNSYALAAAVRAVGAQPLVLGIARDDESDLRGQLRRGMGADALITSAGASVGEHDLVKDVLESLGATTSFWRVRIRPGSPFSFSRLAGMPVFGLPGNPVSALVTFEILVKPALRRMSGRHDLYSPVITARLASHVAARTGLTQFMRVRLSRAGDEVVANLTGAQGSGILSSIARADGLLVVPEDVAELAAGSLVKVVQLAASDAAQNELGFETRMLT